MDTHDHWIVDGNYGVVRDLVWARADRVVWLDFSRVRVSWQMLKRTVQRLASRKELWNGNRETLRDHLSMDADRSLMLYAHQVFEKNRRFYAGAMSDDVWSHIEFFRIQNRRSLEDWLAEKPGNTRVE
jgi:adenylate kinase family enzyme